MARARSTVLALLAATVLGAGCGGAMQPDELARSIGTLESAAAEGALLAEDVAADRTKATFARVHARDLGETVDHEAEKLHDAERDGHRGRAQGSGRRPRRSHLAGARPDTDGAGLGAGGRSARPSLDALRDRAGKLADGL